MDTTSTVSISANTRVWNHKTVTDVVKTVTHPDGSVRQSTHRITEWDPLYTPKAQTAHSAVVGTTIDVFV